MARIREICTIGSQIWAIREFERDSQPYTLLWSVMFYDWRTGEVWGRRTLVSLNPEDKLDIRWMTEPRPKAEMDMIFYRELHDRTVPLGLLCAAIVGRGEKFSLPIIAQ